MLVVPDAGARGFGFAGCLRPLADVHKARHDALVDQRKPLAKSSGEYVGDASKIPVANAIVFGLLKAGTIV